ncbi:MAG TPA: bifunctional DNA-formamidopyrimidine glycosylase/DNA-(apurinic or apyrimidinic site) lyase [Sphingobium sp.]|nr:bifunctional DNA-formamidopyrimidine glycosylase/DNA-(apurinic or apyrimidinic site) lyase [Sphingobium sp.]
MPELPEVETTVAGLRAPLEGRCLVRVEPRRADMRRPFPIDLRQRLTGARVVGLGRRAKYGLVETDRGDLMIFHLGMSGRWVIDPAEIERHDHLVLETEEGRVLSLRDPRRFGFVDILPLSEIGAYPPFATMGPEPLGPDFTAAYLADALAGRIAPIKAMLLDQRIVAGLGNIYVCEALNKAGIAPGRAAGRVTRRRLGLLVEAIRDVLAAAIAAGGSSLRDYVRPDGELGYFAKAWRVYGRQDAPCPCGGTVARRVDGGRSTFWCPTCQR